VRDFRKRFRYVSLTALLGILALLPAGPSSRKLYRSGHLLQAPNGCALSCHRFDAPQCQPSITASGSA